MWRAEITRKEVAGLGGRRGPSSSSSWLFPSGWAEEGAVEGFELLLEDKRKGILRLLGRK
jgi:hypothetical protein